MTPDRPSTKDTRLKLRAEDADDLAVISACLQDAVFAIGEMAYDRDEKRFAAIVVRRRWEAQNDALDQTKAGVHFDTVSAVKVRGIDQTAGARLIRLAAVIAEPGLRCVVIRLLFQDGGEVWLEAEAVRCRFQDLDPRTGDEDRAAGDGPARREAPEDERVGGR